MGKGSLLWAALVFCGVASVARAGEGEPTSDSEVVQETKAPEPGDEPEVHVFGRVMARAGADERVAFERQLGIADARLGVKATYGFADAVVEADLSSSDMLKDAYLRLRATDRIKVYGGQFKAPFMVRELTSTWDLPLIGRGFVEQFLVDVHQLGGRRPGAMMDAKVFKGMRVSAGLFRGARDLTGQRTGEDASARISYRPFKALTVGTSGYFADVFNGFDRFAAGGDATVRFGRFGLTAEALAGKVAVSRFLSQTGILTFDVPLGKTGRWLLQPAVGAEALQLRGELAGTGFGATVGLNANYEDRIRLQVQAERARRPGDETPQNELSLQVGARF